MRTRLDAQIITICIFLWNIFLMFFDGKHLLWDEEIDSCSYNGHVFILNVCVHQHFLFTVWNVFQVRSIQVKPTLWNICCFFPSRHQIKMMSLLLSNHVWTPMMQMQAAAKMRQLITQCCMRISPLDSSIWRPHPLWKIWEFQPKSMF